MTIAFAQSPQGAGAYPGISRLSIPRTGAAVASLALVEEKSQPDTSAKADLMIGLIEQVTARMADTLDALRTRDNTVASLQAQLEVIDREKQAVIEDLRASAMRAESAEENCQRLEQERLIQEKDLERLKQNIERLMAIFNV